MTELTVTTIELPTAPLGPSSPLPMLHTIQPVGAIAPDVPADIAARARTGAPPSLHPYLAQDDYQRVLTPRRWRVAVLENEALRATVALDLGGRVLSLVDRRAGRELLYVNPVQQPANLALRNAWFSGGVEWNIGTRGHSPTTMDTLHAARVDGPDGEPVLRLWEWERIRGVVFQVDLRLPAGERGRCWPPCAFATRATVPCRCTGGPTPRWSPARRRVCSCRRAERCAPSTRTGCGWPRCRSTATSTSPIRPTTSSPPTASSRSTPAPRLGRGSPPSTATAAAWPTSRRPASRAASCSCGAPAAAASVGRAGSPTVVPSATPRSRAASLPPSSSTSTCRRRPSGRGVRRSPRSTSTRRSVMATTGTVRSEPPRRPSTRWRPNRTSNAGTPRRSTPPTVPRRSRWPPGRAGEHWNGAAAPPPATRGSTTPAPPSATTPSATTKRRG